MCHLAHARALPKPLKINCGSSVSCGRRRFLITVILEREVRMKESLQRYDLLAGSQFSCFIGILCSCFIGFLFVGAPFELVASRVVSVQLIFLSEFISWLLLFSGGALLAAAGAWGSYLATPGHQPIRLWPIIVVSEITAVVVAITTALVLSRFPMVVGKSLYGDAQSHIIVFFLGVLVIALSTSLSTWRFGQGVAKGIAMAAGLLVLGALAEAVLAIAVYLLFSLVPSL
jgi:hypothetical protein